MDGHRIEHQVVVAGGGPTGLMLAGELALAGVDVVVVERRDSQALDGSRAGGLHARSLEVMDLRGIADRFIDAGQLHPFVGYGGLMLPAEDLPTSHPHVLALWQAELEPILADWVLGDLGVPILRGREAVDVEQDDDGAALVLADGTRVRGAWLVGCDGGRSVVRKTAGIDFVGMDPSTSWILAEVTFDGEPEVGMRHDRLGSHGLGPAGEGRHRMALTERELQRGTTPGIEDVRDALVAVFGSDFGLREASWISRFTDMARQAATYRQGRVLLAGDAAHVHPPQGGQGLNTGVQDAVNLGWKLAQVVHGTADAGLLDSYHDERHPVGARVLRNTAAQVALGRGDERGLALRETMADLLAMDEPRHAIACMIAGLDVAYDLGGEHPLVGRRMPDLPVRVDGDVVQVASLLHAARPVLLVLSGGAADLQGWEGRVRQVTATHDGSWILPVVGAVEAPDAVLIRPDGHVAWVGAPTDPGLQDALTRWFGQPA